MVKVVGEDPAQIKRITCRNCAAILEYTQSEVDSKIVRDYGGGTDTYHFITCPKCHNEVIVKGY